MQEISRPVEAPQPRLPTEPIEEIMQNMALHGWDLAGIDLLDFTPIGPEDISNGEYHSFPANEVEQAPGHSRYEALKEKRPECLVIDPLTQLP